MEHIFVKRDQKKTNFVNMITLWLGLTATEWCVLALMAAAAVVALCVRPSGRGAAETLFARGLLGYEGCDMPSVSFDVRSDGSVAVMRRGLRELTDGANVSLAVTRIGFDLTLQERIADVPGVERVDTALFVLDFLGPERYHITYRTDPASSQGEAVASLTLNVRPGIHIDRQLRK